MTPCLICQAPVADYDPKLCCSGFECGCMGQPTEPCVCSQECDSACMDYIGKPFDERRQLAGIPLRGAEANVADAPGEK